MISVWETVKCKNCGKEDKYDVSSGVSYKVNNREELEYTGVICHKCKIENLLALEVNVIESYDKEDIEKVVSKRSKELVGYLGKKDEIENIKEIVRKREVFITEDERVMLKEDVETLEEIGVFM